MTSPRCPSATGATRSGAAVNHIAGKSYGRPGRYRRDGFDLSELLSTSAATAPMIAAGMITKTRTVLITDN